MRARRTRIGLTGLAGLALFLAVGPGHERLADRAPSLLDRMPAAAAQALPSPVALLTPLVWRLTSRA
jgi:hypothetical protein